MSRSAARDGVALLALSLSLVACGGGAPAAKTSGASPGEDTPPPASTATPREACAHAWMIMKREAPKEMTEKSDEEAMTQCLEKLQDEAADDQRLHCEIDCLMISEHLKQIDHCVRKFCAPRTGELH